MGPSGRGWACSGRFQQAWINSWGFCRSSEGTPSSSSSSDSSCSRSSELWERASSSKEAQKATGESSKTWISQCQIWPDGWCSQCCQLAAPSTLVTGGSWWRWTFCDAARLQGSQDAVTVPRLVARWDFDERSELCQCAQWQAADQEPQWWISLQPVLHEDAQQHEARGGRIHDQLCLGSMWQVGWEDGWSSRAPCVPTFSLAIDG